MEQPEIKFCSPEMEQTGLFWAPVQEEDQGLDGLLGDLQFGLASGTACDLQVRRSRGSRPRFQFSGARRGHQLNLDEKSQIFYVVAG